VKVVEIGKGAKTRQTVPQAIGVTRPEKTGTIAVIGSSHGPSEMVTSSIIAWDLDFCLNSLKFSQISKAVGTVIVIEEIEEATEVGTEEVIVAGSVTGEEIEAVIGEGTEEEETGDTVAIGIEIATAKETT
jgi:hypothetical protein